ncbi:MAG: hypothetical protein P4M08_04070 [Oligoflexia bacterium]|nr:hypothetical protein [Oligoflexia bacterium]
MQLPNLGTAMIWLTVCSVVFYAGPALISVIYCLVQDRQDWLEEELEIQPPEIETRFEAERKAA